MNPIGLSMDTVRVDICYRPLRIAWAIHSDDRNAFRAAVRSSHTLAGGRYNPIVFVDRPEHSSIIDTYRVDFIHPIGSKSEVVDFPKKFPHLINPLFPETLHYRESGATSRARILDVHNLMSYWRDRPQWKVIADAGLRRFVWDQEDPLSDLFLIQFGDYPDAEEIGVDYWSLIQQVAADMLILDLNLDKDRPIPEVAASFANAAQLSRWGSKRHYSIRSGWDYPGIYIGDAQDADDLVTFWNLRAADIPVAFYDNNHTNRLAPIQPVVERNLRSLGSQRQNFDGKLALWTRNEAVARMPEQVPIKDLGRVYQVVDTMIWQGGAVCPPMMIFGEEAALGVLGQKSGTPSVSFALKEKPFSGNVWFYTQHLAASISLTRPYDDDENCFQPPYLPELNEYFARGMGLRYSDLRLEPNRIGVVIYAAQNDVMVSAIPNWDIVEQIFKMYGASIAPSNAGLMARQLLAQVGGILGARVFKIPGVRNLLKTGGLRSTITKRAALQLIRGVGTDFDNHKDLYIEARPYGTSLTPEMVFTYLVEKRLYRIGFNLECPTCRLSSWIPLDQAEQLAKCELCGAGYDATRQLMNSQFDYRRTGVLSLEKNAQGAVPVLLLLQQITANISSIDRSPGIFLPSTDVKMQGFSDDRESEVDFLIVLPCRDQFKTLIVIGECKDQGGNIDARDVDNLKNIAEIFPVDRFDVIFMFSKLAPFTREEIDEIAVLNSEFPRVVLLTTRELEPYHIYERTESEFNVKLYSGSFDELVEATTRIYPPLAAGNLGS